MVNDARAKCLNILLVDDDAIDRRAARRALQNIDMAFEIEEAFDCAAAREALARQEYDCILLDYQLPDGDGLMLLREIRAGGLETPVIMLTANDDDLVAVELMKAGATDYLSKERSTPGMIAQSLHAALRLRHAEAEARQSKTALQESEGRFRTMIEHSPLSIQTFAPSGDCIHANPAWEELWQATCEGILSYNILRDPQIAETGLLPAFLQAFSGQIVTIPPTLYNPSRSGRPGRARWVDRTLYPVRDLQNNIREVVMILQDVTERVEAQEAIQRGKQTLEALIQASPLATIALDLDGTVRMWNDAAERIFGWSAEEVIGGAFPIVPDDKQEEYEMTRDLAAQGQVFTGIEARRRKKDGSPIDISISVAPVRDSAGPITGLMAVLDDITERKRTEEALREQTGTLETVNWVGQTLSSELDLQTLMQMVTDAGTELMGAEFGAFFYNRIDERGEAYTLYCLSGAPMEAFAQFPMPRNTEVFGPTFRGEGIVRSDDIQRDPRYGRNAPYFGMPPGHLPVHSYLAVPVISRVGEVLGGLFFGHSQVGVFTEGKERLMLGLAAQTAIAMDNARLFESVQNERVRVQQSEEKYRSLVTATSQIVWTTSAAGKFEGEQPEWNAFTGQTPEEARERGWLAAIHPEDQAQALQAWSAAIENGTLYRAEHRLRRHDGVYRHMSIRAVPVLESDGSIREWVGVHRDTTERKEAEDRLRFLAESSAILGSSLEYEATLKSVANLAVPDFADWCAVDLVDENGAARRVETAHIDPAKRQLAYELSERYPPDPNARMGIQNVLRTGQSEMLSEIPDELLISATRDAEHLRLARELGLRSYISAPLIARGRTLGVISFVSAESGRIYGEPDRLLAEELARRAGLAIDNTRLFFEAQARAAREELVNQISKMLRGSLDENEILQIATREAGRALHAGRCCWAMVNESREAYIVSSQQYVSPGILPIAGTFSMNMSPLSMLALWNEGQPVLIEDCNSDPRVGPELQSFYQEFGVCALIASPVFLRGDWAGLFIVQDTEGPRPWTADDTALVNAIADMLALTLENARLYAREHRVADMLQAAFLPEIPTQMGSLTLATLYRPGLDESQVGGDFYDAFALPDGRMALVIADVSGKGLNAAVQTATVKYSLRAFAAEAAAPSLVLTRLNRTLLKEVAGLGEHFVTLFYAVFDPATGRLVYASAGHETQIIKRAGGEVTYLAANAPILGLTDVNYEQQTDTLGPGDTLVLFTDGLTEARSALSRQLLDLSRVVAVIEAASPEESPESLALRLQTLGLEWANGQPQDDMALMMARRSDASESGAEPASGGESDDVLFSFAFPSRPDYAAEVRQAVSHWMSVLGYEREAVEDFQTAVTEAVTNAVRHGSPGGDGDQFHVAARRSAGGALAVEVTDHGPGFPLPTAAPLMPDPEAPGGRGLPLMQQLADGVEYPEADTGHRVRLIKKQSDGKG